jgi:hypothetical protein
MAGGSSGGPWLTGFDPATGAGTVYSVTSTGTLTVDETTGELAVQIAASYERVYAAGSTVGEQIGSNRR